MLLEPRLWEHLSVTLLDARPGEDADILKVRVWNTVFQGSTLQRLLRTVEGAGWWLDQTFVDFNSAKAAAYLEFLAAGDAA